MPVKVSTVDRVISVEISGILDAALAQELDAAVIPADATALTIDMSGVQSITSKGAAIWLKFVDALPESLRVELTRCPTCFMDFASMMPPMTGRGRIESFEAPLRCANCRTRTVALFHRRDISPSGSVSRPCSACGQSATLESPPEEYLEPVVKHQ